MMSQTASVDLMPSASRTFVRRSRSALLGTRPSSALTRSSGRGSASPIHDLRQHLANGGPPAAQLRAIAERKVFHSGGDRQTIFVQVVRHAIGQVWEVQRLATPALDPRSNRLRRGVQLELALVAEVQIPEDMGSALGHG